MVVEFLRFLFENKRWLIGAFLLMLSSSAGQTIFIAQFSAEIRNEFGLSHGGFGTIYMIATLCSAFTLIWLGKLADVYRPVTLGVISILILAMFSLLMANITAIWMLVIAIFGLRLFGQAMLPQVTITAIGRWFAQRRGKAVSMATLGYVLGEATLPIILVVSITLIGWRQTWTVTTLILCAIFLPMIWYLLRIDRQPQSKLESDTANLGYSVPDWTRAQVLRDWRFWIIMLGLLVSPFMMTGVLFHQVHLADAKGWDRTIIPASIPVLALAGAVFSFASGVFIDRFGSPKAIYGSLSLLAIGLMVLGLIENAYYMPIAAFILGASGGIAGTIHGTIWPEIYGTKHLGSIRSVAFAGSTFATSLSPGLMGLLIDQNISLNNQFFVAALYTIIVCIIILIFNPYLKSKSPKNFSTEINERIHAR